MSEFAYVWKTGFGWTAIAGSAKGLSLLTFGCRKKSDVLEKIGHAECNVEDLKNAPEWMRKAVKTVDEYFSGRKIEFKIPLDISGTEFRKKVWREAMKIPYGATMSYGQLAAAAGSPKASRAVGAAMGANPVPLIVPCHRVIGADGSMHGFALGLDVKKRLLDIEKR